MESLLNAFCKMFKKHLVYGNTQERLFLTRSSRLDVFFKKGVLKNFAKFRKTPVPESLF